jgi:hypothetical protein
MARGEITGRKPRVSADQIKYGSGPPIANEINPTAPADPKAAKDKAKGAPIRGPPIQPMAYSIPQFCEAHVISIDTYFRMQRAGFGPVTMKVGGRTLISVESAAKWRRDRESRTHSAEAT